MQIQWFPGHMKKSLNELESSLKNIDMVLCVLDARAPYSCINPYLEKIMQTKPVCYLLNKTDLASDTITNEWIEYFEKCGKQAYKIDATKPSSKKFVEGIIDKEYKKKIAQKNKSYTLKFRVAIVGVPNSGKSTLLNTIAGSYYAKTGNTPGVTRSGAWIKLSGGVELMDNAGTLYPKFEDQKVAENLAIIGSINDATLDQVELSFLLVEKLKEISPENFQKRYNLTSLNESTEEIMEQIAKNCGLIVRGGEPDYERTGARIINDFRQGRMGKITLERP